MNEEDKKLQKHLVDEMMKVSETNPDVMFYMEALMEYCLEKERDLLDNKKAIKLFTNNSANMLEQALDLQVRIDKAIEYINNKWKKDKYYADIENCMTFCEYDKEDLLNILQGSDKDE